MDDDFAELAKVHLTMDRFVVFNIIHTIFIGAIDIFIHVYIKVDHVIMDVNNVTEKEI